MTKKAPKLPFPNHVTADFFRRLRGLLDRERKAFWKMFKDEIRPLIHEYRRMVDDDATVYRADEPFEEIIDKLKRFGSISEVVFDERRVKKLARDFVGSINNYHKKSLSKQWQAVVGVDPTKSERWLSGFMEGAIRENVNWIKSIPKQYHDKIETVVMQGVRSGESITQMSSKIKSTYDVTVARAKFIARDQAGSIYGDLTKRRDKELGLELFMWSTSDDEKVRGNPGGKYPDAVPNHWELDGKIFTWADGVKKYGGLLPGKDYNCRCVAEPVPEEMLAEMKGMGKDKLKQLISS